MVLLTKTDENPKDTYGLSNLTIPFRPTISWKSVKVSQTCKLGLKSLLIKSGKLNLNTFPEPFFLVKAVCNNIYKLGKLLNKLSSLGNPFHFGQMHWSVPCFRVQSTACGCAKVLDGFLNAFFKQSFPSVSPWEEKAEENKRDEKNTKSFLYSQWNHHIHKTEVLSRSC